MADPSSHGHADQRLRRDRQRRGEGDRPEPVVGVQQHRDRQRRDVSREQEVDESTGTAEELRRSTLGPGTDHFQDELDPIGRRQGDQRLGPRLLEAQDEMPQNDSRS